MSKARLSYRKVAEEIAASSNGWLRLEPVSDYYNLHEFAGQGQTSINRLTSGSLKEVYRAWYRRDETKYKALGPYFRHIEDYHAHIAQSPALPDVQALIGAVKKFGKSPLLEAARTQFDKKQAKFLATTDEHQASEEGTKWAKYLDDSQHQLLCIEGLFYDCLDFYPA